MPVAFNHTIVAARDRHESASFFATLFGLPEPTSWGPFAIVTLDGGVFVQFAEPPVSDIQMQHYAFLVDDATFDAIYRRLVDAGIAHWADPQKTLPNQVNTNHGGRGVYFHDPAGHGLEVITRPYGQDSGLSGLTCPLTSSLAAWSENAESSVLSPESSR